MSDLRNRIYIGKLHYDVREKDIERFFKDFGKINDINMKNGYAFVVSYIGGGGGGGGGVSRPSMSACLIESKKDRTGQDICGHRRTYTDLDGHWRTYTDIGGH